MFCPEQSEEETMFIAESQSHVNVSKQTEYIVTKLLQLRPGSFHRIRYQRPLRFRKAFEESNFGFKETEGIYRIGINYEHLASVKEKREQDGSENEGMSPNLTWLVWPRLIRNTKTDKIYARIYTVKGQIPKVSYTLNGLPVNVDDLIPLCLASEFSIKEAPPCFLLDVENFIEI